MRRGMSLYFRAPVALGGALARVLALTVSIAVVSGLLAATPSYAADGDSPYGTGVRASIVAYLPNRIMDILDIVRLRARGGLGYGVSPRASQEAAFVWGNYETFYLGFPGPRKRVGFPHLVGRENLNGEIDADETEGGPNYGINEFGMGLHLGILGVDLAIEPDEAIDAIVGIFLQDPQTDDY